MLFKINISFNLLLLYLFQLVYILNFLINKILDKFK